MSAMHGTDCKPHQASLREHALGLPLDSAAAQHLAACEPCQALLAAERRLVSEIDTALAGVGRAAPGAGFRERAAARARAERTEARPRFVFARFPARMAAALGAAALALVLFRPTPPEHPTPATPAPSPTARPLPTLAASAPSPVAPARSTRPVPVALTRPAAPREEIAVLVPVGQEAAIARFAALMTSGALEPPRLLVEPPDPTRDLPLPAELNVRPLAIAQIPREGADDEGEMP